MKQMLTIDGTNLSDFGVWISGSGVYSGAVRDVTAISVPGRNGDLIRDNNRFKNITIKYPASIVNNTQDNIDELRNFLAAHSFNYFKITDTYHPNEYRLGRITGSFLPNLGKSLKTATFDITLDCLPQRFLESGNSSVTFMTNGSITNNTLFDSAPLIRVYGSGKVGIGENTLTVASSPYDFIDIDCDVMDCYCGANNCNQYVELSSHTFPVLHPGENGIEISGVDRIEIKPRWWRI